MQSIELLTERYELAMERTEQVSKNACTHDKYKEYFERVASFILDMDRLYENVAEDVFENMSLEELREHNKKLYEDILPEKYSVSYANPEFAVDRFGELNGRILSFLYTELRGMIVYAYEQRLFDMTIVAELFLQVYGLFEEEEEPKYHNIRDAVYWYVSDYSENTLEYRVLEQIDSRLSFARDIIMNSDLSDLRYLFKFGEYITDNEIKTAEFLNSLPLKDIQAMADTYTEGYRKGFELANKDLSKKGVVDIRYCIGFERMVKAAILNFEKMSLKPVIYRAAVNSINKKFSKIGFFATSPNRQYDYDHKQDAAIYIDRAFNERRLGVLRSVYENNKELAAKYAGPAVIEVFGEEGFEPLSKKSNLSYEEHQNKLVVEYANQAGRIVNEYIKGEERSFTIIAYPIPEIGKDYEEIFRETVRINTLDYELYKEIQQTIIDTLDKSEKVHIKGNNGNKTDLVVSLTKLEDSSIQTKFENCLADVNIPLGEIFTSPKLSGTAGILNVNEVYLKDLKYKNLTITFEDGMIVDYMCDNFENPEECRRFIKENLLSNHQTLPMGEFAIGTNTTAYVMAQKYDIISRLPILIVEKMGPHFAVGDTCYSWSEDVKVYNPDGKEIFARDNEITKKYRKEEPDKAYFNCHTDITIPYNEIGSITAVTECGNIDIIRDGRFVLPGTEKLNEPFAID